MRVAMPSPLAAALLKVLAELDELRARAEAMRKEAEHS